MQRAANIHRLPLILIALVAVFCAVGCTAALGPGYSIDKQEIEVHFIPAPEPTIHIDATYHLRNDGIRPLNVLELRLPGRRRFHFADPQVEWDGHAVALDISPDNRRNAILNLQNAWMVSEAHTLKLSVEYKQAGPDEHNFSFASDAFFLPSEGWSPQLMPARGAFAKGGVPPAKWEMTIRVPQEFLVHASGEKPKKSKSNGEQVIRYTQRLKDGYPFVIAGRYVSSKFKADPDTVTLWSRAQQNADTLRQSAQGLASAMKAYDGMFGKRVQNSRDLWLVECPVVENCFSTAASYFSGLINDPGTKPTAEMASLDTVMVDLTKGAPDVVAAAGRRRSRLRGSAMAKIPASTSRIRRSPRSPRSLRFAGGKQPAAHKSARRRSAARSKTFRSTARLERPNPTKSFAQRVCCSFSHCRIVTGRKPSPMRSAICSMRADAAASTSPI